MIYAGITVIRESFVTSVEIQGHAGYSMTANDPVCTAVSAVAKAYALTITGNQNHRISGAADSPGLFSLVINDSQDEAHAECAGSMLLHALECLQEEYPANIALEIIRK
ncbi:ribosomal-processing cysteine protease Prp [Spirochaeta dissipatitropha]